MIAFDFFLIRIEIEKKSRSFEIFSEKNSGFFRELKK